MTQQRTRAMRPTPLTYLATDLLDGAWTARWGDWVVHLRNTEKGWRATVWRWMVGGKLEERTQLGLCEGFGSAEDANTWACDLLRENGAKVFVIDKPELRLETILRFHPAPEVVV